METQGEKKKVLNKHSNTEIAIYEMKCTEQVYEQIRDFRKKASMSLDPFLLSKLKRDKEYLL